MPRAIARVATIVLACAALGACGLFGKEYDPTEGWSAQRLYNAGKIALDDGDG